MITHTLTILANSGSSIKISNLVIVISNQNDYEVKVSLETDVLTREGLELKKSLNKIYPLQTLLNLVSGLRIIIKTFR